MDSNSETQQDRRSNQHQRRKDHRVMAFVSPLPPPEEVFFDWLMAVPANVDLQSAANREVERIDRRGLRHPDLDKLRTLLLAFA